MSVAYNPLSGSFETKEPGPQGPAGTVSAAGDGSQATPSISFASDTNTGLFRHAADSIGVSTGGTTRIVVNSSGNVGISTAAPAGKLSVGPDQDIIFGNQTSSGTGGTGRLVATGGAVYLQAGLAATSGSDAPLVVTGYGGVGERLRLTSSGALGVGTASPDAKLHAQINTSTGNIAKFAGSHFNRALLIQHTNDGINFVTTEETDETDASRAFMFSRGGVESMRLTSTGNLALGTTSPTAGNSGARFIHLHNPNTSGPAAAEIHFTNGTTGSGTGTGGLVTYYEDNLYLWNYEEKSIIFGTNGPERMRLTSDGKLGIGNSNPSQPLDVTGWIKTSVGLLGTHGRVNLGNSGGPEITTGALANPIKFIGGNGNTNIEHMRIMSDGVVNVGTTSSSPGTKFNIANGSDAANILAVTGADNTSEYIALGIESSVPTITAGGFGSTSTSLRFRTSSSGNEAEAMRLTSDGNLALGTTSVTSGAKLHVQNASSGATANSQYADLTVENSAAAGVTVLSGASSFGGFVFGDSGSGDVGGTFYDHSSNAMTFKVNGGERARFDSNGNLKLGGTLPSSPNISLNANGSGTFGGSVNIGNIGGASSVGGLEFDYRGVLAIRPATGRSYSFATFQNSYNGGGEVFRIQPDGSVRLGGTPGSSPNISLDADGSADFTDTVTFGGSVGTANAAYITGTGDVVSERSDANSKTFYSRHNGTTKAFITAGGAASFASNVGIGTYTGGSSSSNFGAYIYPEGSYQANRSESNGHVFLGRHNGVITSEILANGSGTFASTVTAKGAANASVLFSGVKTDGFDAFKVYGDGSATFASVVSTNNGKIKFRDNSIENHEANADNGGISFNYAGYQSGATKFRDLTIYNGKNGLMSRFDGSAGLFEHFGPADFAGAVALAGNSSYLTINRTPPAQSSSYTLIQAFADNSLKFEVDTAGAGTFARSITVADGDDITASTAGGVFVGHTGYLTAVRPASSTSTVFNAYQGSTQKINFSATGAATFAGAVTAQGTTLTSDQRFKTNLSDAKSQLADVTALGNQLRNWDWTDDAPVADKDTRFLGLIAQDVETVCPGLVTTIARTKQGAELTPEITDEEGNVVPATYEQLDDSYKGIKNDVLIMKLLGAVAELSAKVAALESA